MKTKRSQARKAAAPLALKEAAVPYVASADPSSMVRTQIYLTQAEYHFLQAEAHRRDEPMAAVIRSMIDEKMELPEDVWTNNPMLRPTPKDSKFDLPEDAAINHDHYLYGTPKRYVKAKGSWTLAEEAKR
jgi:hypothetical protein